MVGHSHDPVSNHDLEDRVVAIARRLDRIETELRDLRSRAIPSRSPSGEFKLVVSGMTPWEDVSRDEVVGVIHRMEGRVGREIPARDLETLVACMDNPTPNATIRFRIGGLGCRLTCTHLVVGES